MKSEKAKSKKKKKAKKVKIHPSNVKAKTTIQYEAEPYYVDLVIPPDGGWGWMIVTASFFANFIGDGIIYTFGIFLSEIARELKTSDSNISIANSMLTAIYFLMGPIACALTNRFGFRPVAVTGGIVATTAMVGSSFVQNWILFCFSYGALGGIAFSMTYIPNILAVGFYFERWRSLATSLAVTGSAVGTLFIPPIFNILLHKYTWRIKFRILSGACGLLALLGFFYKPIEPVQVITDHKTDDDKFSFTSISVNEENPKSIFYKLHNKGFLTNADLVSNASTIMGPSNLNRRMESDSISKFSFKSFKTWNSFRMSSQFHSASRLNGLFEEPNRKCKCKCGCGCCFREATARHMYRDDILYTGSVGLLPEYRRGPTDNASLDYNMSITRVSTQRDLEEGTKCCVCCPESVQRTLATMLDCSLMKSFAFVLLVFSGFFTYMGLYTPYIYLINLGESKKVEPELATFLLSAVGIANAIGRILTGLLTLIPNVNALIITEVFLFLSGGVTIAIVFFDNVYALYTCAAVFGLFISCVASLRSIIAVDMMGLEKLTNAIGIIILFEGIACLMGVPIAAMLNEATNSYTYSFCFAGGMIVLSVFLLLPIKALMKLEKRRALKKTEDERLRRQLEARQKLATINKARNA